MAALSTLQDIGIEPPQPGGVIDGILASKLGKKSGEAIKVLNLGVDFFLLLYLRDVVLRRAPSEPGYDVVDFAPRRIYTEPRIARFAARLEAATDEFIRDLDRFMLTYLCTAVSGELRHAYNKANMEARQRAALRAWGILSAEYRSTVQQRVLNSLTSSNLDDFLSVAVDNFRYGHWGGGGFGGEKWAVIAETGLERVRGQLDSVLFIDRVFDLKHNGGPMFDKSAAVDQSGIPSFLNSKLALTQDVQWTPWFSRASSTVRIAIMDATALGLWQGTKPFSAGSNASSLKSQVKADDDGGSSSDDDDDDDASDEDALLSKLKDHTPDYSLTLAPCPKGVHI